VNKKLLTISLVVLMLALLVLSGCSPKVEDAEISVVKVGSFPIVDVAPLYIGDMMGWFEEEGLTIEYIPQFGAQGIPVLESGDMHFNASESVGTVQAVAQGFDITMVTGLTRGQDEAPESSTMMVAADSEITSAKDLVGKTMAIYAFESSSSLVAYAWLEMNGVDPADVNFVELGFWDMPDALLNGQVDVIFEIEPFRTGLMETGLATALAYPDIEVHAGWDISQFVAKASWVEEHPITTEKFARVISRAIDWINANEDEARDKIAEYAEMDPALANAILLPIFDATVNVDSLQDTVDLMTEFDMLDTTVDINSHIYETAR
jgi:NitT/TauT family transport system substrate-binding protein